MINYFFLVFSLVCHAACSLQGHVGAIQERVRTNVGPTQSLTDCNSQTMADRERIRHLETSQQVDAEPVHVCVENFCQITMFNILDSSQFAFWRPASKLILNQGIAVSCVGPAVM